MEPNPSSVSAIMIGGYPHPERGPLTEQRDCVTVARKKSDSFETISLVACGQKINGVICRRPPLVSRASGSPQISFVLPDGNGSVVCHKTLKTCGPVLLNVSLRLGIQMTISSLIRAHIRNAICFFIMRLRVASFRQRYCEHWS